MTANVQIVSLSLIPFSSSCISFQNCCTHFVPTIYLHKPYCNPIDFSNINTAPSMKPDFCSAKITSGLYLETILKFRFNGSLNFIAISYILGLLSFPFLLCHRIRVNLFYYLPYPGPDAQVTEYINNTASVCKW